MKESSEVSQGAAQEIYRLSGWVESRLICRQPEPAKGCWLLILLQAVEGGGGGPRAWPLELFLDLNLAPAPFQVQGFRQVTSYC